MNFSPTLEQITSWRKQHQGHEPLDGPRPFQEECSSFVCCSAGQDVPTQTTGSPQLRHELRTLLAATTVLVKCYRPSFTTVQVLAIFDYFNLNFDLLQGTVYGSFFHPSLEPQAHHLGAHTYLPSARAVVPVGCDVEPDYITNDFRAFFDLCVGICISAWVRGNYIHKDIYDMQIVLYKQTSPRRDVRHLRSSEAWSPAAKARSHDGAGPEPELNGGCRNAQHKPGIRDSLLVSILMYAWVNVYNKETWIDIYLPLLSKD